MRKKLNLNEAVFHGYWFDDAVKSATPGIYLSWYELKGAPWSKVLVAGNLTRKDLPMAPQGKLLDGVERFTDVYTGKTYTRREIQELTVPENRYILLGF